MGLRGIVNGLTLVMGTLALATGVALAVAIALTRGATARLADATTGLQAAQEVESNLLVYNLRSYLWLSTGNPEHRVVRDQAAARLDESLEVARQHVTGEEERRVLEEVQATVRAHYDRWAAAESAGGPALHGFARAGEAVEPVYRVADQLIAVNVQQARAALEESRRLGTIVEVAAVVLALAMAGLAASTAILVRRWLYRPLLAIREAIHRYAAGDRSTRAGTRAPRELADVARDFNQLAERLERERKDRTAFVGAVAHDLRNPLAALKVAASLRVRPGDDAARERRISLVRRQIDRMERMLGDFLDLSRLEAGKLDLRLEPVDVAGVARNVADLFAATSDRHQVVVHAPEPVVAHVDRGRVEQVLDNLISNAIKYSPDGGQVEVRVGLRARAAVLEVRDRGIGIAPADREVIFEPYRRLESGRGQPGIGLGLAVTRRLVEGHGGRIEVESEPGRGSTFRVELPAAGSA